LTQGRIAAAQGRFSRIRQVAQMCTPYIKSQKWLPWQRRHNLDLGYDDDDDDDEGICRARH